MGDARYQTHYDRVARSEDRCATLEAMSAEEIVQALAAASRVGDPLIANVLATEAVNRMRRVRTAIQYVGEGLCLLDRNGRLMMFNPAAERLTGWTRAEVEGRPIQDTLFPSELWREVMATRKPVHLDVEQFARKEGKNFPVSCTLAPVLMEDEVDGVVIVFRDVSAELRAEDERRLWQDAAEAVYEAHDLLGEGLVFLVDLRVAHANVTFERMSGYSLSELQNVTDITTLVPRCDRAALGARIERLKKGESPPRRVHMKLLRRRGGVLAIEVAAASLRGLPPAERIVCIVREERRARRRPAGHRWTREGAQRQKKRNAFSAGRRGLRGPSAPP